MKSYKIILVSFFSLVLGDLYAAESEQRADDRITVVFSLNAVFAKTWQHFLDEVKKVYNDQSSDVREEIPIITLPFNKSRAEIFEYAPLPFFIETCAWLIAQNMRIVFFGWQVGRDYQLLIDSYFQKVLGFDLYENLKENGHFQVFSREPVNSAPFYAPFCRNFKCSLKKMGLSEQNAVLVVEDTSLIGNQQKPFIYLAWNQQTKESLPYFVGLMVGVQTYMAEHEQSIYEGMMAVLPRNENETFNVRYSKKLIESYNTGCAALNSFYGYNITTTQPLYPFIEAPFDVIRERFTKQTLRFNLNTESK